MKKTRKLFRKKKASAIESNATNLAPEVTLNCGEKRVNGIACVLNHELIAVSTWDGVFIFEYTTQGEPICIFNEHDRDVCGLVHLCDDMVASLDDEGILLTWKTTTGAVQDQLQVSKNTCHCITKASETEVLVGTSDGEVIIVGHTNGNKLTVKARCAGGGRTGRIYNISAYNDIFVVAEKSNVEVWKCSSGKRLHAIEHAEICCAAVSDELMVLGGWRDTILYVHRVQDNYNLLRSIDLRNFHDFENVVNWNIDRSITFISADILMVTEGSAGIFFVSLESGECISHCQLENSNGLYEGTVLSDGRLCFGGRDGYCAVFKPPGEVEEFVGEYAKRMYSPLFVVAPFFSPPLKYIFDAVQEKSIAIRDAFDLVVHSQYHCESIREWACAHLIVIAAVKAGHMPRSRKYKGDDIFWWNHLYKTAALIEMGTEDKRLVIKFIVEAEEAGILGGGCAEMFQETHENRCRMNMLSNTMVDLYARQIATDKQVQSILHHVQVQQAMSFVNAILACIPLAGGVAVHVLSGGMAILENVESEDFAVSGLVESLFGLGKDWSSFITESVVKRFLKAGDVVLHEETWRDIPEANRRAVEAAADGLGISIDELRRRLGVATAEMPATPSHIIVEMVRVTGGDKHTPVGNATEEPLEKCSTESHAERGNMGEGPMRLAEENNEEHDNSQLWKVVEVMQLQMREEKERREILELRYNEQNKKYEENIEEMEKKIEMMELRIKAQDEKIEELEGNVLRK